MTAYHILALTLCVPSPLCYYLENGETETTGEKITELGLELK